VSLRKLDNARSVQQNHIQLVNPRRPRIRSADAVEGADPADYLRIAGGSLGAAADPPVEVVVVLRQEQVEGVEELGREAGEPLVGEAAEDQVHLADAAVPAPQPEPAQPILR